MNNYSGSRRFWQKITCRDGIAVWIIPLLGLLLGCLALSNQLRQPITPLPVSVSSPKVTPITTKIATSSIDVNGYTILFIRTITGDEPNVFWDSKISIHKNDKVVFETEEEQDFSGFYVNEVGDWIEDANDIKNKALKDINGDGLPELIITGYSGGSHCCSHPYVIEFTSPLSFLFDRKTSDYDIDLKDLNRDGVMEIETYDPVFIYWHTSYFASPAPKVVLSLKNGKYQADPIFMRKPAPSDQEISKNAKAIENWSSQAGPEVPWKYALDLIYSGNVAAAKRYINLGWRDYEYNEWKTKEDFLSEIRTQIEKSTYFNDLNSYFNLDALVDARSLAPDN